MLRPTIFTDEELIQLDSSLSTTTTSTPSKTYKIDFVTGEIYAEFVDLTESLAQSVIKTIKTERDRYVVYSSNYGSELNNILGSGYSIEYLQLEIPRLIQESLMIDDRVLGTDNFNIEKVGDVLNISFDVESVFGDNITIEVTV